MYICFLLCLFLNLDSIKYKNNIKLYGDFELFMNIISFYRKIILFMRIKRNFGIVISGR